MKEVTKDEFKWSRRVTILAFLLILGTIYCPWWLSREEGVFGTRIDGLAPWGVAISMGDFWAYQILFYRGGTNYDIPSVAIMIDIMLTPYVASHALDVSFGIFVILLFSLIFLAIGNRKRSINILIMTILLLISTPIIFLVCWPVGRMVGALSIGFYLSFASVFSTILNLFFVRKRLERESMQLKSKEEAIALADTTGVSAILAEVASSLSKDDLQDNITLCKKQLQNLDLAFSRKEVSEEEYTRRKLEIEKKTEFMDKILRTKSVD